MEGDKCSDPKCGGKIDKSKVVDLRAGFTLSVTQAHACSICGLLHNAKDSVAMMYLRKDWVYLKNGRLIAGGNDVTVYFR